MKAGFRTLAILVLLIAGGVPAFAQGVRIERYRNRDVASQEIIVRFRGSATADAQSQKVRSEDKDIASSASVGRSGAVRLRARNRSVSELLKDYSSRPDVVYAEPNYVWRAADVANDTFLGEQWALRNTGQTIGQSGTAGADIKAIQAWDVAEGSRSIVVGMIDSGIDYNHLDLINNMWSAPSAFTVTIGGVNIQCAAGTHGFNAINRTCDPMDNEGHGTHTAGIVGASGNNTVGVSGVSRVASLMALKFLDNTGAGTTADAIAAIEFAIQVKQKFPSAANIRVLNASWGGMDFSQALLEEINLAGGNQMLFVASAGNASLDTDATPSFPASYNSTNLISVAATDNRDHLASFSNTGATSVDLAAPGVDVQSTLRQNFYGRQSGTSMSAAVVSGAASLVLSACILDTTELRTLLLSTVDAVPGLTTVTATGGRLNVNNAVRSCAGAAPASFTMTVNPSNQTIDIGNGILSSLSSVSINPLNGFSGEVSFSAVNVPSGMTASFAPTATSSGATTLTFDLSPTIPQGTYFVGVVATGGGVARNVGIIVTAGVPSACTLNLALGFKDGGSLVSTDSASIHRPPAFADYCTFTLDSDRAVTVQMTGATDAYIYLLSSTGEVLASDDNSLGVRDAQVHALLSAGTYTIEATTALPAQTGSYTLYVKPTRPTITSITPNSGLQGSSVEITIKGTVFFGTPFNVKSSFCPGIVISNIQVIDSTTAKATLALPNSIVSCRISVSNLGGESDQLHFFTFPPAPQISSISVQSGVQGTFVPITLTGSNFVDSPKVFFDLIQLGPSSVTPTTITFNMGISSTMAPGSYFIRVTTSGGTSIIPFTVLLAPPKLFYIYPTAAGPGQTVIVRFEGAGFFGTLHVNAGPKINAPIINIDSPVSLYATLVIAPDAAFGDYPISVTSDAGTTSAQNLKLITTPIITSFSPGQALQGTINRIDVTGSNLVCPSVVAIDGTGVSGSVQCNSADVATSAQIYLNVAANAPLGPRTLALNSPNGTTNSFTIEIIPMPPQLDSISPINVPQGATTTVTLSGARLSAGVISVSGSDVQATTQSSSFSVLAASLTIAANAAVGPRSLTLTNANGTSNSITVTVTPPTWPDLTVIPTGPQLLGGGYDEPFSFIIRNIGTKESTSPITVLYTKKANDTFVSAGSGWTCVLSGNLVTCTILQSIPANSEKTFQFILRPAAQSTNRFDNVEVNSPEDYNVSNNKAAWTPDVIYLSLIPQIISKGTLQPGEQATISLKLQFLFPRDVIDDQNTLTMTFTPSVSGTPADPAAQFATGGRTVSYSFKPNTFNADFPGAVGSIGFQPGTVAGTWAFKLTFRPKSGVIQTATLNVTVVSSAPSMKALSSAKTASGFEAGFTLISSTREVRTLSIQFNTATPIKLSCGGLAGCTAGVSVLTFDVTSLFSAWYANNPAYGTVATLRVPFNIQGSISGSVTMWLTNSVGISSSSTFTIP